MTELRKYPPFDYRIGRLSRDPEDATAGSKSVVKLNLAVKQSFDDGDTEWLTVTVWSEKLQPKARTLRKGNVVAVGGSVKRTPGREGREFVDMSAMILQRAVDIEAEDDDADAF